VVEVVDGDTVRVRLRDEERTVRLVGIDAPEKGHPSRPVEYLAEESTRRLEAFVGGRAVLLEPDREDADAHGRLLRYVFLPPPDGRLANLEMVRQGFARVSTRFPFSRKAEFLREEEKARREGKGVWADGGMSELRWLRENRDEPALVYPAGGGRYAVVHAGWGRPGIRASELSRTVAKITRLRRENTDGDFAREARRAGFRPIAPEEAGTAVEDRPHSAAAPSGSPGPPDVVSWEDAGRHVGREITVEGTVVRTYRSARFLFLNFHPNWKKYLSIVVPAAEPGAFPAPPEEVYRGKRIRVTGTVSLYEGRLQIVVQAPDAITLLPGPASAPQ
jgi:endonuclease YncB( thermonuclease family)